jgi:bifunctional UDP-N-acetylglucosamine pyrophosphorylase/glucosamine-1-phosphate N-acetyltransferase
VSASGPAAVIILAAGKGIRMRSPTPKPLHSLSGRTMLGHCLATVATIRPERLIVVVGHGGAQVSAQVRELAPDAIIMTQTEQRGTAHAVRVALRDVGAVAGTVIVTYVDTPLVRSETLTELARRREQLGASVVVLTAIAPDPGTYGRIARDSDGTFLGIIEPPDCTQEQLMINEVNSGLYAFDGLLLSEVVKRISAHNAQDEEYMTDAVALLRDDGYLVSTLSCDDYAEIRGVNTPEQLAQAASIMNARTVSALISSGVQIADPASTWVDMTVRASPSASIGPRTRIEGSTTIHAGVAIGPDCLIRDCLVETSATITNSTCEAAVIGGGAILGPYVKLEPGSVIESNARIRGDLATYLRS